MRALVKMHLAMRAYSYDELCEVLINPATNRPISVATFERCFKREIKTAKMDIDTIALGGFVQQLRKGNMAAFALMAKRWGWGRNLVPFPMPALQTTGDIIAAQQAITAAVISGQLSPAEGAEVAGVVELQRRAIETHDHEQRLAAIEDLQKGNRGP
jgi:hypothetical protein